MESRSSSDSTFDPSPIPNKRRRIIGNRLSSRVVEDPIDTNEALERKAGRSKRLPNENRIENISPAPRAKKALKPKHRVRVVEAENSRSDASWAKFNDIPCSQPWSLRGPIWTAPDAAAKPINPPSPPRLELAPLQLLPNPSNTRAGPAQRRIMSSHKAAVPSSISTSVPKVKAPPSDCASEIVSDYGSEGFDADFDVAFVETSARTSAVQSCAAERQPAPRLRLQSAPQKLETAPRNLPQIDQDAADLLIDLPSDAFSDTDPSPPEIVADRKVPAARAQMSPTSAVQRLVPPRQGLRQMTLFGNHADHDNGPTQLSQRLNFAAPDWHEPTTHHKLDKEAMKTWLYPMNLGSVRDYQYNIVARGLFHNLLVALPTGLGKTFIAATIMLNWYRWTIDAQIVFVAPTKPLVSQQVEACFNVAGIPRSQTTMLTGGVAPALRSEEWNSKRVFFMTPQTIMNDLRTGICDPKRVVLLVVDEAHRATGNYAYVEVVRFLRRFNQSFRVLGLTATPGNTVVNVQNVIDGLGIARVEIRTEFSLDIRGYIHSKVTDRKIFEYSEELKMVMDLISRALAPLLNKLCQFNAYWNKDPLALTAYGLTQARQKWTGSDAGRHANAAVKGMVQRMFQVLASLAHSIDLLKFHGIGPFYHNMSRFRNAQSTAKSGKYEREILESEHFQKMMTRLQFWMSKDDFVGHPKLEFLQASVLEHFSNSDTATNSPPARPTRVMIFAHFRDSAEEIVRVLKRNSPIIRPHVFIGQAAGKESEGMDQKRQLQIINEFKEGKYNTLVATSIGEEGLDIGEIDLIICYDSSASPIRMLQRMGRTGRKRAGSILLLLMRGKEENSFVQAKDNYEKMQHMIAEGTHFEFREDVSPRILPREAQPALDKRVVEIPVENVTEALPLPTRGAQKLKKRPRKRFNMPDNVISGFVSASNIEGEDGGVHRRRRAKTTAPIIDLAVAPDIDDVLLTIQEERDFERQYLNVAVGSTNLFIDLPDTTTQPSSQRQLCQTSLILHGEVTKQAATTLATIHSFTLQTIERWETLCQDGNLKLLCGPDRSIKKSPNSIIGFSNIRPALASVAKSSLPSALTTPLYKPMGQVYKTKTMSRKGRRQSSRPQESTIKEGAAVSVSSSPPATDPRLRIAPQGIDLGSVDTSGDENSDEALSNDLDGFIVDDSDHVIQDNPQNLASEVGAEWLGCDDERASSLHELVASDDESIPDLHALQQGCPKDRNDDSPAARLRRKRRLITDSDVSE